MRFSRLACPLLLVFLLAAGCQRLNIEKSLHLGPTDIKGYDWTPPKYDQKITVTATATGAPISVYLVKTTDIKQLINQTMGKPPADIVLGSQEKAENINFTVDVSKGTSCGVLLVSTGKNADVKLKISGR
jgi:hypothetical protein